MSSRTTRPNNQASNQGKRFECGSSPTLCAGLLGLPDVNSLKTLIVSPEFNRIYKQYAAKRQAPWNLHTVKIPRILDLIEHQGTREGYGGREGSFSVQGWNANDWVAHYIVALKQATYPEPAPEWGPLPGEKNLEADNRVWQLLRLTNWSNTASIRPKFWRASYPNRPAKVPGFMKPLGSRNPPGSVLPDEIVYEDYDWQLRWGNFAVVEQRITSELDNGKRKDAPVRRSMMSKMPDPRRWDGEDWRDKIRREWDMKRLHIEIDTLTMEVTGDNDSDFWNCIEDYAIAQRICRGDDVEKAALRFVLRTSSSKLTWRSMSVPCLSRLLRTTDRTGSIFEIKSIQRFCPQIT